MSPAALEATLGELMDTRRAPRGLERPWRRLAEFALRPGKRIRPALVELGWHAGGGGNAGAGGGGNAGAGVRKFAAGLELVHAFLLVHDEVADRADERRGGPALHRMLGAGRLGEDLAIVAGDLLFVEALAAMLGCGLPRAARAVREVLDSLRDTAAGQYLDLALASADLGDVAPAAARRAEYLKTARYSFESPLTSGALLAGARPDVVRALRDVARPLGLAFQLQDDLLPFKQGDAAGKPALADLAGNKKTWLVARAWRSLGEVGQRRLRALYARGDLQALSEAAELLTRCGAVARVEAEVSRLCARSRRAAARPALARVRPALEAVVARVEASR